MELGAFAEHDNNDFKAFVAFCPKLMDHTGRDKNRHAFLKRDGFIMLFSVILFFLFISQTAPAFSFCDNKQSRKRIDGIF